MRGRWVRTLEFLEMLSTRPAPAAVDIEEAAGTVRLAIRVAILAATFGDSSQSGVPKDERHAIQEREALR